MTYRYEPPSLQGRDPVDEGERIKHGIRSMGHLLHLIDVKDGY